jgi:hypothetical protein
MNFTDLKNLIFSILFLLLAIAIIYFNDNETYFMGCLILANIFILQLENKQR